MSKINEYKRKLSGFENLDNVIPYESVGTSDHCNMTKYTIRLVTHSIGIPQCSWFYQAVCKHWKEIRATMKEVGAKDVNKTKGEAAKEAGDFLGLVGELK